MHLRTEIKNAGKTILLNKTLAAAKVEVGRFVPFKDEDAPFIAIYAGPETNTTFDTTQDRRELELYVECLTRGLAAEADLDNITNQVEHAMIQDRTMGNLVHEVVLERTDPGYDEDSRGNIQGAKMTFKVTYFVEAVADPPEDAFLTAEVDYDSEGTTHDHVDLPQ